MIRQAVAAGIAFGIAAGASGFAAASWSVQAGPGATAFARSLTACPSTVTGTAPPSTPNLNTGSDSGSSSTDDITNDTTPTFTGTATPGSTVELIVDGGGAGSTTAVLGNWSITPTLAEGRYCVAASATLAGLPLGVSASLEVVVDKTPPNTFIDEHPPASSPDNTPTFAFHGSADAVAVECRLTPGSFVPCPASPATYGPLVVGTYTFTVRGTDAAGNTSIGVSWTFDITP